MLHVASIVTQNCCYSVYPRNMACFRYIFVNILRKDNNNNNNWLSWHCIQDRWFKCHGVAVKRKGNFWSDLEVFHSFVFSGTEKEAVWHWDLFKHVLSTTELTIDNGNMFGVVTRDKLYTVKNVRVEDGHNIYLTSASGSEWKDPCQHDINHPSLTLTLIGLDVWGNRARRLGDKDPGLPK